MQKSNLIHGKTIQCKHCNVMAGHATVTRRLWGGRLPDSTDKWIKSRWDAIRYRCYDPTSKYYARYGGRGIKLSDEFLDPRVFVSYVKELPDARPDMQIDRIDNSKGYERGNLRWVSARENCNNRRCPCASRTTSIPLSVFVEKYTTLSYEYARKLYRDGVPLSENCMPRERHLTT